jgi:L-lysine exporter family protein LysE/ArgO
MISFFQGSLIGFGAAFGIGPGSLLQCNAATQRGLGACAVAIAGLYGSDLVFFAATCFSPAKQLIVHSPPLLLKIIGSILLISFGIAGLLRNNRLPVLTEKDHFTTSHLSGFFFRGFIINISNPFALAFWLGILSISGSQFGLYTLPFYLFITGYIATSISMDFGKCILFCRMRRFFTLNYFVLMNRILSFMLLGMGLVIFWVYVTPFIGM